MFQLNIGASAGRYPFGKDNYMPSVEVNAPVSSPASDRLALGVGWVRPGVAAIGGALRPTSGGWQILSPTNIAACFEGNEE